MLKNFDYYEFKAIIVPGTFLLSGALFLFFSFKISIENISVGSLGYLHSYPLLQGI
jgi:hypothetical protein